MKKNEIIGLCKILNSNDFGDLKLGIEMALHSEFEINNNTFHPILNLFSILELSMHKLGRGIKYGNYNNPEQEKKKEEFATYRQYIKIILLRLKKLPIIKNKFGKNVRLKKYIYESKTSQFKY